jgi:hypothetical protein
MLDELSNPSMEYLELKTLKEAVLPPYSTVMT